MYNNNNKLNIILNKSNISLKEKIFYFIKTKI